MGKAVTSKDDLAEYFAEAKSWDDDRILRGQRSTRLAWTIAGFSAVLAVVSVGAVAMLVPLKTVVPYVITVDRSTGASELTSKLSGDNKVTFDDGVRKYFLSNYVRNREGWVPQARKEYFETVLNLSAREEQARWTAFYSKDNPQSPQALLTDLDTVFVEITSVTFLNDKAAQVRFRKIRQRGATKTEQPAIANIIFALVDTPATEALRLANPLGFQVLTYRADNEVTP
jgi:type IV secretion system protein VirB8